MKNIFLLFLCGITSVLIGKNRESYSFINSERTICVNFYLTTNNSPEYKVFYGDKLVINSSSLGIIREDANFYSGLEIINISKPKIIKSDYTMLQGKRKNMNYSANQYVVHLQNKKDDLMDIIFQLSADGIALRYYFPSISKGMKKIIEEKTTYNFESTTKAWLQPMSKAKTGWCQTNPSYEEHYEMGIPVNAKPTIGEGWVYPALFNSNDTWVLISESNLSENYCGSHLVYDEILQSMKVTFPQKEEIYPNGVLNPQSKLPWYTPWRIIALGSLKTITESTLGTDVAEPAIKMNTSFIKSGLASWSWALLKDDSVNFETSLKFIEYASKMNWGYCLIDVEWNKRIGYDKMKELATYAKSKNVKLLVWYNSSGTWNSTVYEPKSKLLTHADRIKEFAKLKEMGIAGLKVDFFGGDGQSMIAYYHEILKDAAAHQLVINFHGATLPRGWQRTYPNLLTTEAIKGEEFITFFQANADLAPSHCAMIPFARNVFDPMDFTPMVLESIPKIERKTTAGFELALPVLFLSGIQHIAETPDGMAKMPDFVVNYLKDIPTNWDDSKFIEGYPSKYIVMARKKDGVWHIVGINGENSEKEVTIDLSFVINKIGYLINHKTNKFNLETINKENKLKVNMEANGGFVIKI